MNTALRALLAAALLTTACSKKKSSEEASPSEPSAPKPGVTESASEEKVAPPPDTKASTPSGEFKLTWGKTEATDLRDILKDEAGFGDLVDGLSGAIALPRDVGIVFEDCGEENAFYDPRLSRITMCYELLEGLVEMFAAELEPEEAGEAAMGAFVFVFFHELGHALIDVLELPVTGKEEDAADQWATLVLLEDGKDGEQAAMDSAVAFSLMAENESELAFWGEHSFGEQRFYNILCLVYGADPSAHRDMVESDALPEERAERCSEEYRRVQRAWEILTKPHAR